MAVLLLGRAQLSSGSCDLASRPRPTSPRAEHTRRGRAWEKHLRVFGRARVQRSVFGFGQKPNFRLKQLLKTTAPRSRVAPTPRSLYRARRASFLLHAVRFTTPARMLSLPTLRNLHGRWGELKIRHS